MSTSLNSTTQGASSKPGAKPKDMVLVLVGVGAFAIIAATLFLTALALQRGSREDSPEKFADIADRLFEQPAVFGEQATQVEDGKLIAALRMNQRAMAEIANSTHELSSIASNHAKTLEMCRAIMDPEVAKGSGPSAGLLGLAVVRAVGGAAVGSSDMLGRGANDGLDELMKSVSVAESIAHVNRRTQATRWELAGLAPKYSGTPSSETLIDARFVVLPADPPRIFVPVRPERIDATRVVLTNVSGHDLQNVLVVLSVSYRQQGAKSREQLIWLRNWKSSEKRVATLPATGTGWLDDEYADPSNVALTVYSSRESASRTSFSAVLEHRSEQR